MSTAIEQKRCAGCGETKPTADFARDASRADGLTYWCRPCRNARQRRGYTPKERERGRRAVPARDDDRKQARRRVNYLVDAGILPAPATVPCTDCGHEGDRPRHEFDHYRGYAPEHHEDVQVVCAPCHHRREAKRRG